MNKLCCDICGGTLVMQPGGRTAVCDSCGMQYSVERVREKVQEIKGVVSVEGTVKVQNADFTIRGGVLERYNGNDVHVVIPDSVVKIGKGAFRECLGVRSITLPNNVIQISSKAFLGCRLLVEVNLSNTLEEIGEWAFYGCCALKQLNLPGTVKTIGDYAFYGCQSLAEVRFPDGLERIGNSAFGNCRALKYINLPETVKTIGNCTFEACPALCEIVISEKQKRNLLAGRVWSIFAKRIDEDEYGNPEYSFENSGPWFKNYLEELEEKKQRYFQEMRRKEGKCQYCGGRFTGWFAKRCANCGKPKDYDEA